MGIIGIDYGSKLAGTTVIAHEGEDGVHLVRSNKKQDADQMIIDFVRDYKPDVVGIDAPLSLPGVYRGLSGYTDYHYRACDKELKAMSPMFLGGLTARAMKLKHGMEALGIAVHEVYPVKTGKLLFPEELGYRSKTPDYLSLTSLLERSGFRLAKGTVITSSHDLDSVLALKTAQSISTTAEKQCGDSIEGLIYY